MLIHIKQMNILHPIGWFGQCACLEFSFVLETQINLEHLLNQKLHCDVAFFNFGVHEHYDFNFRVHWLLNNQQTRFSRLFTIHTMITLFNVILVYGD